MATFIDTTLTKRSGTTTIFNPSGKSNNVATFRESSSTYGHGAYMTVQSKWSANSRRTKVAITVPTIDSNGENIIGRPTIEINMYVPEGTSATDIDDLVGYAEAMCASALANANDILVDGVGVY